MFHVVFQIFIFSRNLTIGRRSADISADDKWQATIGRSSADDRPMICSSFKYDIGRLIGRSSADHRPIAKTPKLSANGKTSSPKGNDRSPENKQVFLNSSLVSKSFFQLVKGSQLCSPWLTKFRIQSRVVTLLQICKK